MTEVNPTPQDREMAQAEASQLAITICGCANRDQHRRDVAALLEYAETARLQGRREALEEAARALEADAQLCDCHAREAGECACGAWDDYKTVPMIRVIEIVRKLGEA